MAARSALRPAASRAAKPSMAARMSRIERGDQIVVGVNKWTEGLPSPLLGGEDGGAPGLDAEELAEQIRVTVLHETAHFFGLDEDDLERLGYD